MIDRDLMIGALTSDGMFPAMLTKAAADKMSDEELYEKFLELEKLEKGNDPYDEQKEHHGKVATYVWIGSGIYFFVTSDEVSLFSWQAAGFIVIGMFAAAIIFGLLGYGIQRGIAKLLVKTMSDPLTDTSASAIRILGLAIMVLEAILIFYGASLIFDYFV